MVEAALAEWKAEGEADEEVDIGSDDEDGRAKYSKFRRFWISLYGPTSSVHSMTSVSSRLLVCIYYHSNGSCGSFDVLHLVGKVNFDTLP